MELQPLPTAEPSKLKRDTTSFSCVESQFQSEAALAQFRLKLNLHMAEASGLLESFERRSSLKLILHAAEAGGILLFSQLL